jgi:hypothetical protein
VREEAAWLTIMIVLPKTITNLVADTSTSRTCTSVTGGMAVRMLRYVLASVLVGEHGKACRAAIRRVWLGSQLLWSNVTPGYGLSSPHSLPMTSHITHRISTQPQPSLLLLFLPLFLTSQSLQLIPAPSSTRSTASILRRAAVWMDLMSGTESSVAIIYFVAISRGFVAEACAADCTRFEALLFCCICCCRLQGYQMCWQDVL